MFVRKLYYDNTSGRAVSSFMMQGNIHLTSREEDISRRPELMAYKEKPNDLGLFLWTEPDSQVEENMLAATSVRVDVSQTPHAIIYDFTPLPEGEETMVSADEVIGAITGEVL